ASLPSRWPPSPFLLNHSHNRIRILTFLPSRPQPTSPTVALATAATSSLVVPSLVTVAPSSSPPSSAAPFFLPYCRSRPSLPSLSPLPIVGPSLLLSNAHQLPAPAIPVACWALLTTPLPPPLPLLPLLRQLLPTAPLLTTPPYCHRYPSLLLTRLT
ncbi:hypothetical protein BHM03_00061923, partial [Ensete ventricosum]